MEDNTQQVMTPSRLRANLYRLLDRVLETGRRLEIERNGKRLRIIRVDSLDERLSRLEPHPDAIVGDPEDLVHIDWSDEWRP